MDHKQLTPLKDKRRISCYHAHINSSWP